MARRYKRKRKDENLAAETVGILMLLGIAVAYAKIKETHESNPQLLPLIIVGLALVVSFVIGLMIYRFVQRLKAQRAFTMTDIDTMDGVKFEYYLAGLLRKRGYTGVKVTEKYDLGVDIIAKKDGTTWGIQAKRYKSMVKVAAVRQAYTALAHYKCDRAMVVSNSTYSNPAKTLASETNTVLIGREQLAKWVYEVGKQR